MCGLTGAMDLRGERPISADVLDAMTATLTHRGPDGGGRFLGDGVGLGFRRLSIIDLEGGDQPIANEDGTVVLVCNGEIFNYRELRVGLEAKGHRFRTRCDVEVLVHLYEEHGTRLLAKLNGQFAFAIYDRARRRLFLARDHVGILPLFYAQTPEHFVFGSEIKAILQHPGVERAVDLTGLDQVLTFPGLVSPRTMFRGVSSLEGGHYLLVGDGEVRKVRYWDLDYPLEGESAAAAPDQRAIATLRDLLAQAVRYRLQADVPVGFYLSGGLDSSLIAALIHESSPPARPHSFAVAFPGADIDESRYQRLMAEKVASRHHQTDFEPSQVADSLRRVVLHAECPVKETYNACSLALSRSARRAGVKVVLSGEGADELFAGYLGYRFDRAGQRGGHGRGRGLDSLLEDEVRQRLWGDPGIFYERDYDTWRETRLELYSPELRAALPDFDCLNFPLVDTGKLRGRHPLHQRSYLDVKLRLADHLLGDHGDRMAMANSVEARYPFLDVNVVAFAAAMPPRLKLHGFVEKHALRQLAQGLVPQEIIQREKFGFRAPGSPSLIRQNLAWVNDLLSYERVKRQGYFAPEVVERLKATYGQAGFEVHPHLDDDLLLVVLTFGLLLDIFKLPDNA